MSSAIQRSERQALRRIAKEYEREGYTVMVEPTSDMLPDWLGRFQIDLLASNNDEYVVVEVKSQPIQTSPPPVDALARAVDGHKGWRLEFVVIHSRGAKLEHQRERLLDTTELKRRIELAHKLQTEGLTDAAVMMLWSSIEGALRRSAVMSGVPIESFESLSVLKQLHFEGLLTSDQFGFLRDAANIRNATAHGLKSDPPDQNTLSAMRDMANDLVNASK